MAFGSQTLVQLSLDSPQAFTYTFASGSFTLCVKSNWCVCVWQLAVTKIPNLDAGFQAPLPFLKSNSDCHYKERKKKKEEATVFPPSRVVCVCLL
jgi:hypothetical protein